MIELSRKEKGTQVQAVSHFGWAQDPRITSAKYIPAGLGQYNTDTIAHEDGEGGGGNGGGGAIGGPLWFAHSPSS